MYSEQVLDHFHHPRNVGEIDEPSAVAEASNPVCGDAMKLWILVRDGKICEAKFKVHGCVPAVACASWLTEAIKGKPVAELATIGAEEIEAGLGGLPKASRHASALAIFALREAIKKISQ
jgi:NifU-like protein involved in Fe-S cluster formation